MKIAKFLSIALLVIATQSLSAKDQFVDEDSTSEQVPTKSIAVNNHTNWFVQLGGNLIDQCPSDKTGKCSVENIGIPEKGIIVHLEILNPDTNTVGLVKPNQESKVAVFRFPSTDVKKIDIFSTTVGTAQYPTVAINYPE